MPKRSYPYMQVDAFTTVPFGGNPCAIILDADDLDTDTMQGIAREMNLSKTSFVLRSDIADVRARYFTPAEEIPLAGHPTIATIHALAETGRIARTGDRRTISFQLQVGPIPVDILAKNGAPDRVIMTQKKPAFLDMVPRRAVSAAFGLSAGDFVDGVPIQVVSTGTPQLMIAVRSRESLKRVQVDFRELRRLRADTGFFSTRLFCTEGITDRGTTVARHFAGPPDVFEDPFTGSATGGMAAFLWRYDLIEDPLFAAEQGHWMHRHGSANVEVKGPRDNIETVCVGGPAVTILRGELCLDRPR